MSELVSYFGYGANRDRRMMAAITGKPASKLVGYTGILKGFGLAIQNLDQVPATLSKDSELPISPQEILRDKWGEGFRSYVIFPKVGQGVIGTIWKLTPDERERVRDWELVGDWYQDAVGTVDTDNGSVDIITESLGNGQTYATEVNGIDYPTWLQPAAKFEVIAGLVRQEYDERLFGTAGQQ